MTTVTKESLAARIAELESGARSLKEDYTLAAYKMLLATMEAEPVALQPELAKVIYHFRDWNEGFPVERFKADYVISWMLVNYPPVQPVPLLPDELKEAAADLLTVLDEYPEQLVPINRRSHVVRALRAAVLDQK